MARNGNVFRVPVGPTEGETEIVELSHDEGRRVNDFMKEKKFRFPSPEAIREFLAIGSKAFADNMGLASPPQQSA